MSRGMLIAIEGIDGVGKKTQSTLLCNYIKTRMHECGFFSFPRYSSPTGRIIGDYLRGDAPHRSIRERARLYSNDRLAARDEINALLGRGVDVVCDRYVLSNVVYFERFAQLLEPELTGVIGHEILEEEFGINELPQPDLQLILMAAPTVFNSMMEAKGKRDYTDKKLDIHEASKLLMDGCRDLYEEIGRAHGSLIYCTIGNELLAPDIINQQIIGLYEAQKVLQKSRTEMPKNC